VSVYFVGIQKEKKIENSTYRKLLLFFFFDRLLVSLAGVEVALPVERRRGVVGRRW
jgi:hypothetical protein